MGITLRASQKRVAMTLLADKPTLAFFGVIQPTKPTVWTAAWSLACCGVSMFRPLLQIGAKTHPNAKHSIEDVTRLRL